MLVPSSRPSLLEQCPKRIFELPTLKQSGLNCIPLNYLVSLNKFVAPKKKILNSFCVTLCLILRSAVKYECYLTHTLNELNLINIRSIHKNILA